MRRTSAFNLDNMSDLGDDNPSALKLTILNWDGIFRGRGSILLPPLKSRRDKHNQRNNRTQQIHLLRIPTGRRQTSWLFTSAARKLNQGVPGTNSTSGQSGS